GVYVRETIAERCRSGAAAVGEHDSDRLLAEAGEAGHCLELVELLVVADVQAARVANRLEVPGLEATGAQGRADEGALALVGDDGFVEALELPAVCYCGAEFARLWCVIRFCGEIHALVGVVCKVVELVGV